MAVEFSAYERVTAKVTSVEAIACTKADFLVVAERGYAVGGRGRVRWWARMRRFFLGRDLGFYVGYAVVIEWRGRVGRERVYVY